MEMGESIEKQTPPKARTYTYGRRRATQLAGVYNLLVVEGHQTADERHDLKLRVNTMK